MVIQRTYNHGEKPASVRDLGKKRFLGSLGMIFEFVHLVQIDLQLTSGLKYQMYTPNLVYPKTVATGCL